MELLRMARFEVPKKMKEWSLWALWWFLVGGGALWLLVGSVAYWVKKGWLPPDAAGWVQAIGSIGAVGVAIAVSHYTHKQETRKAQAAENIESFRVSELATQAIYECYVAMDGLNSQVYGLRGFGGSINLARLEQSGEVLRMLLSQRPPVATVDEIFNALAHAAEVSMELSKWSRGFVPDDQDGYLASHVKALRRAYEHAHGVHLYHAQKAGKFADMRLKP